MDKIVWKGAPEELPNLIEQIMEQILNGATETGETYSNLSNIWTCYTYLLLVLHNYLLTKYSKEDILFVQKIIAVEFLTPTETIH